MSLTCWHCNTRFLAQKELKNHLGTVHGSLTVICPFCFSEEKLFKRVSDLKSHVRNCHLGKTEGMPAELFSENNGYWGSVKPLQYSRLIKPTPRDSKAAVQMLMLILDWTRQVKVKNTRTRQDFLEGWKEAEASTSSSRSLETPVKPTEPIDYFDILNASTIQFISMVPGAVFIDLFSGTEKFRVTLLDKLFDSPNVNELRRLTRRTGEINSDAIPFAGFQGIVDGNKEHRKFLADFLGIQQGLLETVLRQEGECQNTIGKPAIAPSPPKCTAVTPEPAHTTVVPSPVTGPKETTKPRITIKSRTPVPPVTCTVTSPGAERNPSPILNTGPKIREPLPTLPSQRTRAAKLQKMGGMPQGQPARRTWDKEEEVELTEGTLTICWPPRKWKDLDPQQKLLQWELAAMQILKVRGDEYQSITQTDLLDQFNFLALPGIVSHKPPRRSSSYMANKGRLYTYELLRAIANEEYQDNNWLSMVEGGAMFRDTSNDVLLKQCASVKLRLSKK